MPAFSFDPLSLALSRMHGLLKIRTLVSLSHLHRNGAGVDPHTHANRSPLSPTMLLLAQKTTTHKSPIQPASQPLMEPGLTGCNQTNKALGPVDESCGVSEHVCCVWWRREGGGCYLCFREVVRSCQVHRERGNEGVVQLMWI